MHFRFNLPVPTTGSYSLRQIALGPWRGEAYARKLRQNLFSVCCRDSPLFLTGSLPDYGSICVSWSPHVFAKCCPRYRLAWPSPKYRRPQRALNQDAQLMRTYSFVRSIPSPFFRSPCRIMKPRFESNQHAVMPRKVLVYRRNAINVAKSVFKRHFVDQARLPGTNLET